jgi:hypothetical protein
MLAKRMERMSHAARAAGERPVRWLMTAVALETLREIADRDVLEMDAPQLQDIEPPCFMGLPIEVGTPTNEDPPVDLILERSSSAQTA